MQNLAKIHRSRKHLPCAIHGFLREVRIHRLRSAIHGSARSTDCAQHKHARGICISPCVGPYSYGELHYCDRLQILTTSIYIITPLLTFISLLHCESNSITCMSCSYVHVYGNKVIYLSTSTHKPVLARAPSSYLNYMKSKLEMISHYKKRQEHSFPLRLVGLLV